MDLIFESMPRYTKEKCTLACSHPSIHVLALSFSSSCICNLPIFWDGRMRGGAPCLISDRCIQYYALARQQSTCRQDSTRSLVPHLAENQPPFASSELMFYSFIRQVCSRAIRCLSNLARDVLALHTMACFRHEAPVEDRMAS